MYEPIKYLLCSCGLCVYVAYVVFVYLSCVDMHSAVWLLAARISVKFMILYCSGDSRMFVVDSCLHGGAFGCTSSKTS